MPVDFISATKATRSHHIEYKCYLLQYDHNISKGIRKLVRQPANTRNNISGLGVWMYPLGPLFPLRGTSTVYPQIAVGFSTDIPELFKRRLKRYRQMIIPSFKL